MNQDFSLSSTDQHVPAFEGIRVLHEPLYKCRVLLFRGRGLVSALIRWQTRSQYSHVALLLPDGSVLESWPGKGVRRTRLKDWQGVDVFRLDSMDASGWSAAIDFFERQIGKGYDWWSVIRFITRNRMPANDKWFCSEVLFAALAWGGRLLLRTMRGDTISPGMLSLSPLLLLESHNTKPVWL